MFVSGRVVNDVRLVLFKDHVDAAAVADGADEHHQVQVFVFSPQFLFDIVGIVFVNIKDDQLFRLVGGNLPAELAADGTASAGDQDDFTFQVLKDLGRSSTATAFILLKETSPLASW